MASPPSAARLPALLSVNDVAHQLRLSTKTVRRMIARGDLPVHRLGRQLRVTPNDLATFIHSHRA